MNDFQFEDLIEIVEESYSDFREDAFSVEEGDRQAIERFFYEFQNVIDRGIPEETIIISTLCLKLQQYKLTTISKRHFDKFMNALNNYDAAEISCLNEQEIRKLNKQVKDAKSIINNMQVIY